MIGKNEEVTNDMALSYVMGYLQCLADEHMRKDGECFCNISALLRTMDIKSIELTDETESEGK